ncbi:methylated-DNA--[protein]-cysteine S-methyltransferase [Salinicoccus hispanicus]|uniref:Methylated-DNA--protein-cysteine methyltransferase n=2 Tax=Salinicoccus hispanicus TaxID=157225 RepID=A0A6N8U2C5_9STAP|nr:methylated-DNA--[protein]-cysteine S-methyltransferase [Salinicoccus hispanicus]
MTELYYMETPIGWLKIRSEADRIVELDHAAEAEVVESNDYDSASLVIRQCASELREYFSGKRTHFDVHVKFTVGTPFQQKVWQRLSEIPYGETISYKALASDCGGPNHSRAVANANGRNPISIIIPCHRVIASDGTLGGYTGGLHKKRGLLQVEGIDIHAT